MIDAYVREMRDVYVAGGSELLNTWMDYNDIGVMNLEEMGFVLGVTRERIRQIENNALSKLKHPRLGLKLKDYFREDEDDSNLRYYGGSER